MLTKDQLLAIQRGFEAKKLYAAGDHGLLEIGLEGIVEFQLSELIRAHVKEAADAAYVWLKGVIFAAKVVFQTAKEAYVHVMTVLTTLIAVADR